MLCSIFIIIRGSVTFVKKDPRLKYKVFVARPYLSM